MFSFLSKCGHILLTRIYGGPNRYRYDHIARDLIEGRGYSFKGHAAAYMLPADTLVPAEVMGVGPSKHWYFVNHLFQSVLVSSLVSLVYIDAFHFLDHPSALLSSSVISQLPIV
jgi:hypothetical protein